LSCYAGRPLSLIWRYIARRKLAHGILLLSIFAAIGCALAAQYGIRNLIDALPAGHVHRERGVHAFIVLVALIFADNLLWRIAGWISAHTFVATTGDIRQDMFEYLAGHAPSYFADKQPGVLSSRMTSMATAVYVHENALAWSSLPPAVT
ncbi:ABC transporter transmembrane domain-containing protein, partial [Paraburkholderia sp. JHI2823]|uniref:ABC transporter transmembrane domain-containing protein n=1 Tax=Paraburkholderia sp. JHI2823 TaxID=3112960 RepID=UPI003172B842